MIVPSQPLSRYKSARNLPRRYSIDRRFKIYSKVALLAVMLFLATLFIGILMRGLPAFQKTQMALDIHFDPAFISTDGRCRLGSLTQTAIKQLFENPQEVDTYPLQFVISPGACQTLLHHLRHRPKNLDRTVRIWLPVSDDVDLFLKSELQNNLRKYRRLKSTQIEFLKRVDETGRLRTVFNSHFFTQGDARNPEYAGIFSAFLGSFYLILISLLFAFPVGIASALYLQEFNQHNNGWQGYRRLSHLIEVNISNLAAVPSIVFGLLGLTLFLGVLGLPRSSALVGGLTLGLMILPVIILTARSALKGVPKSIRYAAQALGASDVQVVFHHVLPLALPGILTGTIIAVARALGETAPLLMIGMMAFVKDKPYSPLDPASALPAQIFAWSRNPEPGFIANAAAGILVLLVFLIALNMIAILLRRKYEHRWA